MQARAGDGLVAVAERASAGGPKLDILIVDASGTDPSQAMTCPPAAFLEQKFLHDARESLADSGLLIMNCVCRSQAVFDGAVSALQVWACRTCKRCTQDICQACVNTMHDLARIAEEHKCIPDGNIGCCKTLQGLVRDS